MSYHLLCQQVREDHVIVIHEKPFSVALKRSFVIGLDLGMKWTLCCDADVLVARGSVRNCIEELQKHDDDCLGLSGPLHDKFYGDPRNRGFHLYRTKHLAKALRVADAGHGQLRPETTVKNIMAEQGNYWIQSSRTLGLHDHEQFYRDIFRKMVTRSQKSPRDVPRLLNFALSRSKSDTDFLVAGWGLSYGRSLSPDDVKLHSDQWLDVAAAHLTASELEEKDTLPVTRSNVDSVQKKLRNAAVREWMRVPSSYKKLLTLSGRINLRLARR